MKTVLCHNFVYDFISSHTLVPDFCNGDEGSQWISPTFHPSTRIPLTDLHQNWHAWLRCRRHKTCKIL